MTLYAVRWFLEEAEVTQAVALLESKYTQSLKALMCQEVTLLPGCGDCIRRGVSLQDEKSKRYRMTSQRADQYHRNIALRDWQYTASRLQIKFQHATGQWISDQTIYNRIHEGDLTIRCAARGSILTRCMVISVFQEHQN